MSFDRMIPHGNLRSYRRYTIPTARRKYGYPRTAASAHQKAVQRLLHVLFVGGPSTTWELAKADLHQVASIRNREKAYRRLLVGRTDRGRYAAGLLDVGLVIKDRGRKPYARYRLSLYGILYGLDVLDPARRDIDRMAGRYAQFLPRIFGLWPAVRRTLGADAYNLRILAQGIYLDNVTVARPDSPLYELMSYVHIKYAKNFEHIEEGDLADQISYWFYTYLLYGGRGGLKRMLASDRGLDRWYRGFFFEARRYYADRSRAMRNSGVL